MDRKTIISRSSKLPLVCPNWPPCSLGFHSFLLCSSGVRPRSARQCRELAHRWTSTGRDVWPPAWPNQPRDLMWLSLRLSAGPKLFEQLDRARTFHTHETLHSVAMKCGWATGKTSHATTTHVTFRSAAIAVIVSNFRLLFACLVVGWRASEHIGNQFISSYCTVQGSYQWNRQIGLNEWTRRSKRHGSPSESNSCPEPPSTRALGRPTWWPRLLPRTRSLPGEAI